MTIVSNTRYNSKNSYIEKILEQVEKNSLIFTIEIKVLLLYCFVIEGQFQSIVI